MRPMQERALPGIAGDTDIATNKFVYSSKQTSYPNVVKPPIAREESSRRSHQELNGCKVNVLSALEHVYGQSSSQSCQGSS